MNMTKISGFYSKIAELRERYYKAAIGKNQLLQMIDEAEVAEQVYNSNAIENSTLSLEETEKILLQIDLDRYISEREIFEAKNLARVVSYINQKAQNEKLTLENILLMHKMLLSNINDGVAGRFRNEKEITGRLEKMLAQYNASSSEHIIRRIALLHLNFEHIHPFVDGNGRIGRVMNNFLLIREGFVPINIKFIDRNLYYDAFKEFDEKQATGIMEEIVGKAITNSYHKRLAYLEGASIMLLSDYAKQFKLSHSNLLNKANRQTIEAFMEKGIWKIGVPTT